MSLIENKINHLLELKQKENADIVKHGEVNRSWRFMEANYIKTEKDDEFTEVDKDNDSISMRNLSENDKQDINIQHDNVMQNANNVHVNNVNDVDDVPGDSLLGTSAMRNHLISKHPETFPLLSKDNTKVISMPPQGEPAIPGTSGSSTSMEKKVVTNQRCSEYFKTNHLWDINDAEAKKYHYLIAEMIALDNQPIHIVEKVGFRRLLQNVLPSYAMPSPDFISQQIIPDISKRIFAKIKTRISGAHAVSITTNILTCSSKNYVVLTAHWFSPEFQLQCGMLHVTCVSEPHTENIVKELNSLSAQWNIEQSKIHIVVHNIADMVKVRLADYNSTRCFIQSLHRVMMGSLNVQSEVTDMIATCRRIVTHLNHSKLRQAKLLALQKELSLPEHKLLEDVDTTLGATYNMVQRLLEQRKAISVLMNECDTVNLTPQQWSLMEQFDLLLKPFEEIITKTSSGLSCISEVIPNVAAIKKYLNKDEVVHRTVDLLHMRESLKAELESTFNYIGEDPNYLIATFLDPRFKTNYLNTIETERARQKILLEYIKMTCDESPCSGSSSASPTPSKRCRGNETDPYFTRNSRSTFWDCFKEVAEENNKEFSDQEKNPIVSEMDYYVKAIRIDRDGDPYNWWSVNLQQYPLLSKFARVYLSAPCSSVYNDRLFSEAGHMYLKVRNRFSPKNYHRFVFIHYNLQHVNFEY